MLRAAIYARVSSAAQRDKHTIENQLRILPAFVAAQGWTLTGTYIDDGRSAKAGKLDARDGFARLLADAELHVFDLLIVVDVDRLTRTDSIEERAQILGPFQRLGIDIVTPSGGRLDMRSFLGEFWVTVQALVAAEENRKRASRVKAGKLRAIAEGRKPSGPTPIGLRYERASGQWSIDEVRAKVVREVFARVIGGEACKTIADDFHERGVPPPRGPWSSMKVWRIVRARHVIGEWIADTRTRTVVRVPAVIDETTWETAQAKLMEHSRRGLRKTWHVYLLEGLATCGMCGSPMAIRSATTQRHGGLSAAAYICRARKTDQRGIGRCVAPVLPVAEIDARVWSIVSRALVSDELATAVARRFEARAADVRDWQADVKRYQARLDQIERASAAILARFRRGTITEAVLDLELAAAGKERAAVDDQIKAARRAASVHRAPQESPETWLAALRTLASSGTPEKRQRVVQALVPRGGAIFVERDVEITMELDEVQGESKLALVQHAGCRTLREDVLARGVRLRLVA